MSEGPPVWLDLRGLPPPEPLVLALEAASSLHAGCELVVVTEQRPVHLLPQLLQRGLNFHTSPRPDGYETRIHW